MFKPSVFGFLPTEIKTTSQLKSFLFPSLSKVETTALLAFFVFSQLYAACEILFPVFLKFS